MNIAFLIPFLFFGLVVNAYSQAQLVELTFSAEYNEQYVPLDSILIENLIQGGDTTIYSPDTVLVLDILSGINNNTILSKNNLTISQNYPNPFSEKTEVNLYLAEQQDIKIVISDILGRELPLYENPLERGSHTFSFYPGNEKYYFCTVNYGFSSLPGGDRSHGNGNFNYIHFIGYFWSSIPSSTPNYAWNHLLYHNSGDFHIYGIQRQWIFGTLLKRLDY